MSIHEVWLGSAYASARWLGSYIHIVQDDKNENIAVCKIS